jgi:coenzyme F420-0:L-glutamate ligase/coenzyme F420-1:gamma-L-glutamate ligase
MTGAGTISLIPIEGIGEVGPGDEIADLILAAAAVADYDVIVVTQKVVSKAEGRLVALDHDDLEARRQLILSESTRVLRDLRERGGLVISETRHGFVCANAGVDLSNVAEGWAALLPVDPDRSARHIRDAIKARTGLTVAVIVSDTFGRAWRHGLTDVAIGCAGIAAVVDLRGTTDTTGRALAVTEVCVVDELAAAAELAKGKSSGIPAVIVRGADRSWFRESSVRDEVVRPYGQDLFR